MRARARASGASDAARGMTGTRAGALDPRDAAPHVFHERAGDDHGFESRPRPRPPSPCPRGEGFADGVRRAWRGASPPRRRLSAARSRECEATRMGPYARACRVECRGAAPRIVFPLASRRRVSPAVSDRTRERLARAGEVPTSRGIDPREARGWDDERVARGDGGDVAHGGEDRAAARGEVVGGERGVEDAIGDRVRRGGPVGGYLCVVLDVRQGPGWRGCVGVDGRGDGHEAELDDDAVSAEGSELPLERGSSRRRVVGSGGELGVQGETPRAHAREDARASSPRDGAGKDAGGDPRATRRRTRRPACGPEEARIARSRLVGSRSRRSTARVRSPPTDPRVGVSSVTSTVARASDRATWRRRTRGTSCSATRRPPRSRNATRISNPTRAPTARRVARRATRALASRQRSVPEKTRPPPAAVSSPTRRSHL